MYVEEKRIKYSMWKTLDQFKFIYPEGNTPSIISSVTSFPDSAEINDDADTEVWECTKEGCAANVELNKETNLLVGHSGQHSCDTVLKMEINRDLAHLDEFVFLKEASTEVSRRTIYIMGLKYIFQELPSPKCPKGHKLAPCDARESGDWICDKCDKRSNGQSWRCSEDKRETKDGGCDFDLCSTCAQQIKDTGKL